MHGECVELRGLKTPDIIGTGVEAVNKLYQRQSCDPNDVLPQDLIEQVLE